MSRATPRRLNWRTAVPPRWFRPYLEQLEGRTAPGDVLHAALGAFDAPLPTDLAAPPAPRRPAALVGAAADDRDALRDRLADLARTLVPVAAPPAPAARPPGIEWRAQKADLDAAFADPLDHPFFPQVEVTPRLRPLDAAEPPPVNGAPGDGGLAPSPLPPPAVAPPGAVPPGLPDLPVCPVPDLPPVCPVPVVPPGASANAVADAINQTGFDLYQRLAQDQPGNLALSPYSLSTALALAFAGARGETAAQMAEALHYLPVGDRLHGSFAALIAAVNAEGERPYQFSTANRLWAAEGLDVRPEYADLTRDSYGPGVQRLDFRGDAEQARQTINAWVEAQTHGKIKDLLPQGTIHDDTALVLTNTVYFKADWARPFDEANTTQRGVFHVARGQDRPARLMNQTGTFDYFDGGSFQALALDFRGGDQSMVVLLPRGGNGLGALERSLSAAALNEWVSAMQPRSAQVTLPAFEVRQELRLGEPLREKMPLAFSGAADFSGITPGGGQVMEEVVQKVVVAVNEQGVEAAAATAITFTATSIAPQPPADVVFRADRPFLYLIRDNASGAVLFLGRVTDPGA